MLSLIGAAILAFLAINLGMYLEIACEDPDTDFERMCKNNAPVIKWFSSVALFIIVVVGAYRYTVQRGGRA